MGYVIGNHQSSDEMILKIKVYKVNINLSKLSFNKFTIQNLNVKSIIPTANQYVKEYQLGNYSFPFAHLDESIWNNQFGRVYNRWLHGNIWLLTLEKEFKKTKDINMLSQVRNALSNISLI